MAKKSLHTEETPDESVDPLFRLFDRLLGCYTLEVFGDIPALGLKKNTVLYAQQSEPQPKDLIICASQSGKVILGRFHKRKGNRIVLQAVDGQLTLIIASMLARVFAIQ